MTASPIVRDALAADADAAVPLIYSSGPAAFDYVFARSGARPSSAPDFLRRAFVDGRGEFGYRTHCVVVANDRVVGVGAGYSGAHAMAFTLAAARQIFAHYGPVASLGVIRRGLAVERVVPPPAASDLFYVGHLGIATGLRGRGIGRHLIEHLLQRGRAAGFSRVALDVSCENPRAQALYEAIGFRTLVEHRSALRNGDTRVPDHHRMEMAL